MDKAYNPRDVEKRLYDWWEAQGYFKPRRDADKKPFVISMPPPNVTGILHLGHAITAALEDAMIRYHRMKGEPTLWVPGSDHAGIATQNVVERELGKQGLTRHDVGREKFIEKCWEWRTEHGAIITEQHRRLGVSCDWERERFTLDEGLSHAVRKCFVDFYNDGLIYRGAYLVNWCPRCTTAISDLENEHEEAQTNLWYVRYPLLSDEWNEPRGEWGSGKWAEGATEFITVATTRPETILGDTAVAVNPADERYTSVVGRTALLPAQNRPIPIIADEVVESDFGTGAVKITPAHDPNDYETGRRHSLGMPDVMTDVGTMSDAAGLYAGQERFACRANLVEDLQREGLLVKIEPHTHAVGHCQRCHTITEPRISTQWFVKIKPLAEPAIEVVRDGRIRIIPERFDKIYYNWMENIRDWCISRQLWWGHRIPVWYCDDCGKETCTLEDPTACAHCGGANIHQDEDVLDTWFSSGLWPFSTLGWPAETDDLKRFYPTSTLETGYDILFFWVARMIMQGLYCTNDIPFDTVYLHGLVRNEKGTKISKSMPDAHKYDPLLIIEEFGADALRFTLLTGSTPGNDMKLSPAKIEGNRNFANKIWNAARYVNMQIDKWANGQMGKSTDGQMGKSAEGASAAIADLQICDLEDLTLPDRWILSRHNNLIKRVTELMDNYQFGEAGRQIYDFLWGEYCDWYIEIAKTQLRDAALEESTLAILVHVLERTLRLLHPFMPFVTEEVYQHLKDAAGDETWSEAIIVAPYPPAGATDDAAEREMQTTTELVRAIRNARAEYEVEPARYITAIIAAGGAAEQLRAQAAILTTLARLDADNLVIEEQLAEKPEQAVALVIDEVTAYLPLAGMVDIDRERARLNKEVAETESQIARLEKLLGNAGFVNKAPTEVVEGERAKLADYQARAAKLTERLAALG